MCSSDLGVPSTLSSTTGSDFTRIVLKWAYPLSSSPNPPFGAIYVKWQGSPPPITMGRSRVRSSLRHENEKIVRQNKQTNMPQGKLYFIIHLLKMIGQKPLQQTKASYPRLGETADTMDQIHLLPPREQQKGAKATAATWQARGHGQRTSQDFL